MRAEFAVFEVVMTGFCEDPDHKTVHRILLNANRVKSVYLIKLTASHLDCNILLACIASYAMVFEDAIY